MYTYTYDSANRLLTVSSSGGMVSSYAYNGQGDRLSQAAGGAATHYTLDLAAGLTQVLADGTRTYLYGTGRMAQVDGSRAEYFLGDALGSVRQLADAEGEVTLAQSYAPYGEVLSTSGTETSSYGFTEEATEASGLVYLRARYYAPGQGRFVSRDPWRGDSTRPLSLNGRNYVEANPINYSDSSGKCADYNDGRCDSYRPFPKPPSLSRGYRQIGTKI